MISALMYESIMAYNDELISNNSNITLKKYIIQLHDKQRIIENWSNQIILDLLDELLTVNNCSISYKYLEIYDIIKSENNDNFNNVISLIIQYKFKENIDYQLLKNVSYVVKGNIFFSEKYHYFFTAKAFKISLIGCDKPRPYRLYYIKLEEYIKYYDELQLQLLRSREQTLLNKIKQLEKSNKELIESNKSNCLLTKDLIMISTKIRAPPPKIQKTSLKYYHNI